jgi:hypothetical protein
MSAVHERGGIFQKPVPPLIKQPMIGDPDSGNFLASPTCWAAALASWLKVARGRDWTVAELVARFKPYTSEGGMLQMEHLDDVTEALDVRMDYEEMPSSNPHGPQKIDWDYLSDKLMWGHVYLILIKASGPAHAVVVHGVSRDSRGNEEINIMDPMYGYKVGPIDAFMKLSSSFIVGWPKGRGMVGIIGIS